MFEELNPLEFSKKFSTDENCYNYLVELKWSNGYQCIKCGYEDSVKGKTWYCRRCKKCQYNESATCETVFHNVKFSIHKAFHMYYLLSVLKKEPSTVELSNEFNLHKRTCELFKRKVQKAMKSKIFPIINK